MQLKQIGAVFIIAFMFTGMFGFVMNTEMVDVQTKSYSTITPGESIVFNSGVTQWEEYNPVQNLTGVHVLQKQRSTGDPFPSNVVLPLTDTPSKYVYNRAFAGYHSNIIGMNTDWNYSASWILCDDEYHGASGDHFKKYLMHRLTPGGGSPGSGDNAYMKVYTDLALHIQFSQWFGFKAGDPVISPHPNIDWEEISEGSWESIPLYGGGYGLSNFYHMSAYGPEWVYEIRSCFEIYEGRVADDGKIVHKYYNNPKEGGHVILYPLSDTLKNKEDKKYGIVDKTVIGVSKTTGSPVLLENLYGLVYVGNEGKADIYNDGHGDEHMSEVSDEWAEVVNSYASLTYTYKLSSLDSEHTAWIYDEPTRMYFPATQLADGEYLADYSYPGARYLVFMEKGDNVADGVEDQNALKTNWSVINQDVHTLAEPDYPATNYPDTDIPLLTVFVPSYQDIKYIDPQKWDILNDPGYKFDEHIHSQYNGALQWDNGERTGIIKYWGQVGLRVGTDDTHQHDINKEEGKEDLNLYGIPHSRVWWSVPENPEFKYAYYICTIDLLHKTATCEGVIGEPTGPLDYVLSGTVYDMEAHSDVDGVEEGGTVPKYKWPEYFDAGKWKEDQSYSALVTYTDYDVWKYGKPGDDVSIYGNLRFYVLSTTVATDPQGKLWGDPQFYLSYYIPDVFGGEDKEYVWDKDGDTHVTADVFLTNNNGRFFIKSAVQYGTSFIVNNQEFQVSKDGLITIDYNGKSYQYPVDDVQFEYIIQKNEHGENVGTKIYLVLTDYSNKSFPVGGVVGDDGKGGKYSWEEYSEMRGWVDPTDTYVPIKADPVVEITIPRGMMIKGEGSWYFLSNIDLTTIIQQKEKRLEVDSGKFTLTVQSAVMIFLGVSLVGLAGLCYYTNQRIPLLGWVAVGGVVLLSLSIMFAMS